MSYQPEVCDKWGRKFEELDALRAQCHIHGSFTLLSEDGIPLCGRVVDDGSEVVKYVAVGWSRANERK